MPEPYCLAMVLCDNVHQDATTGKFTILGTFSTLGARTFPAKVQFAVYHAVTDGLGPTDLRLRFVNASCGLINADDDEGVIFEFTQHFDFANPLLVLESRTFIRTTIPAPGLYHCELWAGEELLMSRRVLASQVAQQAEGEGANNE